MIINHLYVYIISLSLSLFSQELKEIQNRLVTSACESFVAAKLKDDVSTHPSAGSLATPHSLSPSSTRPSSVASGNNLNTNHIDGCDLDALVGQVSLRAQLIAQAHKNKLSSQQPMSRSFANISELQDNSAESAYRRARLQQFKFSSECGLHSELEGSAQLVMRRMDKLVQESKKLERREQRWPGQGEEPEDQWEELDMELSLSEPNLIGSQDSQDSLDTNGELKWFHCILSVWVLVRSSLYCLSGNFHYKSTH